MSEMHASLDGDLMSLLRRESSEDLSNEDDLAALAEPPPTCDDPSIIHDIAAMVDGNGSRADVERISSHLGHCRACRILIATVAAEITKADGSTNLRVQDAAAPAPVATVPVTGQR